MADSFTSSLKSKSLLERLEFYSKVDGIVMVDVQSWSQFISDYAIDYGDTAKLCEVWAIYLCEKQPASFPGNIDAYGDPGPPLIPTDSLVGTIARVSAMAARHAAGMGLYHPDDNPDLPKIARRINTEANGGLRRLGLLIQSGKGPYPDIDDAA
jgi:hypothetical protein